MVSPLLQRLPVRISKYFGKWCVSDVLVWNKDSDILTDSPQCILGVVLTGIG